LVEGENSLYTGYARTGRGEERQRPRDSPEVAMERGHVIDIQK